MARTFVLVSKEEHLQRRRELRRAKAKESGRLQFTCKWCEEQKERPKGRGQRDRIFCLECESEIETKIGKRLSEVIQNHRYKVKGAHFDLTQEYLYSIFPRDLKCPVLKVPMRINTRTAPSLDRKDPNKGYVQGNVEFMSLRANQMKTDASIDELKLLVSYLESTQNG